VAHLSQEVDGSLRRNRTEALDQHFNVESIEELHDVIEGAVDGDAEIEELDRLQ
jgi:hypothetical protein